MGRTPSIRECVVARGFNARFFHTLPPVAVVRQLLSLNIPVGVRSEHGEEIAAQLAAAGATFWWKGGLFFDVFDSIRDPYPLAATLVGYEEGRPLIECCACRRIASREPRHFDTCATLKVWKEIF